MNAPVSVDNLSNTEIDRDGHYRERFVFAHLLRMHQDPRILRNASRIAKSTEDFL